MLTQMSREAENERRNEIESPWPKQLTEAEIARQRAIVHQQLREYAKRRAENDAGEAPWLCEADRLQIWLGYGYSNFLDYLERELGYRPRTAVERLRVAEALAKLPEIHAKLAANELPYSHVRELTRVATPETEARWVEAALGKNARQVEELVSGHVRGDDPEDPIDPDLRRRLVSYDVTAKTFAMLRQVRVALESERGEKLDDDELLQTLCRRALERGAAEQVTAPAAQLCRITQRGWQNGAGVDVEVDAATIAQAKCDAVVLGAIDAETPARATTTVTKRKRAQVFARDRYRCTVPGCRSARNLDVHHVRFQAHGGKHPMSNSTLVCSGLHRLLREGLLAIRGSAPDQLSTSGAPT